MPLSSRLKLLALVAFIFTLLPLIAYVGTFGAQWSNIQQRWAEFGDFFGGFLNPILSLLAFLAVLHNLQLQSNQIQITRDEFQNSLAASQAQITALREQADREELALMVRSLSDSLDRLLDEAVSPAGTHPQLTLRHVIHEGWRLRSTGQVTLGPYGEYVRNARLGGSIIEALHNRLRSAAEAFAHFVPQYERLVGTGSPIATYYSRRFRGLGSLLDEVGGTAGVAIDFFKSAERT